MLLSTSVVLHGSRIYMEELVRENAGLTVQHEADKQAISDLHRSMANGDPRSVCSAKCLLGEANCKPVWRGEEGDEP